jgi:hypothetical protein
MIGVTKATWLLALAAGALSPLAAQLAMTLATILAPAADWGTWALAAWTVGWTGAAAAAVALAAARDGAWYGAIVGLVTATIGVVFYGPFGPGAAWLFALTVAAGTGGGALVGLARRR